MKKKATQAFAFVDGERTFSCTVETTGAYRADLWWWFTVSTERTPQRYAPFRHAEGDTQADVQPRIVRYYDEMLARRAAPPVTRWSQRPAAAKVDAAGAAATPGATGAAPASGPEVR